jgi:hypothetical protein
MIKRNYACDYCDKKFLSRAGQASHQRHIHPETQVARENTAKDFNINNIETKDMSKNTSENIEVETMEEVQDFEAEDLEAEDFEAKDLEVEDLIGENLSLNMEAEDLEVERLSSEVENTETEDSEVEEGLEVENDHVSILF